MGGAMWILVANLLFRVALSNEDFYVLDTKNLALNKPTIQSSTLNHKSSLAVNGNYDDFSQTEPSDFNWWAVDLEKKEKIASIKAHNRRDCCQEELTNVSIWTSDQPQPGIPDADNSLWTKQFFREKFAKTFIMKAFNDMIEARHVAVVTELTSASLNLAEVEIFGFMETTNVARAKPALQSENSNSELWVPSVVNNGMIDDCSRISGDVKWWQVDLEALHTLYYIRIYKGIDCSASAVILTRVLLSNHSSANPPNSTWKLYKNKAHNTKHWELKETVGFSLAYEVGRHVRVETLEDKALTLSEVKVYVRENVAFKRPTSQTSTFEQHGSHLAVNGYLDDYTQTQKAGRKYWELNMLEIFRVDTIIVLNRRELQERTAKLSLLTAKLATFWVHREYLENGFELNHRFFLYDEFQFIRLESNNSNTPLSLAELTVFESRYMNVTSVSQSSTKNNDSRNYGARQAVDRGLNTHAITNFYTDVEQWWMAKLVKIVFMNSVKIYFNKGMCQKSLQSAEVPCKKLSSKVSIKTSTEENPSTVTLEASVDWSLCHIQDREPTHDNIHVECNRNERHRLVQHISLLPTHVGHQINLGAVQMFAKNLPELSDSVNVTVQLLDAFSFRLTFSTWLLTDFGSFPPTSYKVELQGESGYQIVYHSLDIKHLSSKWTNLIPGKGYIYRITCQFRGFACPGKAVQRFVSRYPTSAVAGSSKQVFSRELTTLKKTNPANHSVVTKKAEARSTASTVLWSCALLTTGAFMSLIKFILN